jgi:hypothetical protein
MKVSMKGSAKGGLSGTKGGLNTFGTGTALAGFGPASSFGTFGRGTPKTFIERDHDDH